jgi:glycosyltransferase involved in cell wall biosynthesis
VKLLFIVPHMQAYDSVSVRERGCGGTEKAATYLTEALTKLGEDVRLVTTWDEIQRIDHSWPDVVITQHAELFERFDRAVVKVWWCHQATDRPFIRDGARLARRHADQVVTLSVFHQQNFLNELGMESTAIGYGIWREELAPASVKDPGRLIYASVPQRGLDNVPALFAEIRALEPEATFAVCSSNATWGMPEQDDPYQPLFDELRQTDGVELLGSLPQKQLYAQFARASIFFYPATYIETYCLAMSEAMAHGCLPIITEIGALPERWAPSRSLVEGAVAAIRRCRKRHPNVTSPPGWLEIAERWVTLLS